MMSHPSLDALLGGDTDAAEHAATCAPCGALIALGSDAQAGSDSIDLLELPRIERALYTAWCALDGGGMGYASTARDRRLGRVVVIKELRSDAAPADREALAGRLEREARLTARLQHPSIIGVHEAGRWPDGEPFYTMPYIRGRPLDAEIAVRATARERLGLLAHVIAACEAIAYAHGERVLHRDLKPSNIMIGDFGETVVIDWGLAKTFGEAVPSDAGEPTADGMTRLGVGTPQYMPPEQARGEEPGPQVDVYALGATLYHLLAGTPPYGRDNADARQRLLAGPPRPLVELSPGTAPELIAIVSKAMARDPGVRFATALELAAELQRYTTGQLTLTHSYSTAELVRRFARRHSATLAVSTIAVVALAAGAAISAHRIVSERDRAEIGEAAAKRELASARGVTASRLASRADRRLEALELALQAGAVTDPPDPARQGLFDAIDAGRAELALAGHGGPRIAVSADGTRIATAGLDRALWIHDVRDGRALAHIATGVERPYQPLFSPAGDRVLVCNFDAEPVLFDLGSGSRVALHGARVATTCAFLADGSPVIADTAIQIYSPDGGSVIASRRLDHAASVLVVLPGGAIAVGDVDGGIAVWDPQTGVARRVVPHHRSVSGLAAIGTSLASASFDGSISRWDAPFQTSEPRVLADRPDLQSTVAFAAGELFVAAAMVRAADAERYGSIVTSLVDGSVTRLDLLATSPDRHGGLLAVHPGELVRLDARLAPIERLAIPGEPLWHAAIAAGERIVTTTRSGELALWDAREGASSGMYVGHTAEVTAAIAGQDGTLVTASLDGTLRTWRDHPEVIDAGSELLALERGRDGALAAIGLDGKVRLVRDGRVATILDGGGELIQAARFSPDGARIATAGHDGRAIVWDAHSGAQLASCAVPSGRGLTAIAWSADGTRLATGDRSSTANLWRAADCAPLGTLSTELAGDTAGVARIEFVGERVAIGYGRDATAIARASDLARERMIDARLIAPPLADGRLAVAGSDGSVRIADPASATGIVLGRHEYPVTVAATSAGRIATADAQGQIFVFDRKTRARIRSVVAGPAEAVTSVAFSSDERFVIAGYAGGLVRTFPISLSDATARGCATLAAFGRACQRP